MLQADLPDISSGVVYVSAWVRLAETPPLTDWLVLFELREDPWTGEKISLDGVGDGIVQLNVATDPSDAVRRDGARQPTPGRLDMHGDVGHRGRARRRLDRRRNGPPAAEGVDALPTSGRFTG